ncbi:uncharacterized protein LOC130675122 [Microplitis mediator]|uniref:uncharacterized protein LOC130675122 n=1 Tax=Microplitis mediator TaxID=375433 RepID=UPI002556F7E8|nr:uncharacterized protein LOC130675122 [Microplitis mediator]
MAEEPSPYLSAIQKVAGSTPGDKFETLYSITKKIIESENQNASMPLTVDSSELPEALKPLVQVEVARLSEQFEGICKALKSDDSAVFVRAFRAKWFFNGSHENCRVQYYKERIFPYVSLQSRHKIIKTLAKNLTAKPAIAEEFYTALTLMYGEKQAHPLLKACSESFIWRHITKHKLRLNNGMVRILFDKYPGIVVKYLNLSKKSDDEFERNLRPVNLQSHASFLPRLLKEYPDTFMELIEMHNNNFNIKLSRRSTNLFFKKFPDALMRNPQLFQPMLDLKVVHKNLTDLQFKAIFKQQFPPDIDSFEFDKLLQFLEFLPKDDKLHLMTSTFEEVYGVKLLDCTEKITPSALSTLPRVDQMKLAKVILQKMKKSTPKSSITPWIVYLPCHGLLRHWMLIIKGTLKVADREELMKQLISTCQVNADNDSFLKVIDFIAAKHMIEPASFLWSIIDYISRTYPINTLTDQQWKAVTKSIVATYNRHKCLHEQIPLDLIIAAVRGDLDRSITKNTGTMTILTRLYRTRGLTDWRVFKDNLRYDRICLEHFITNVLKAIRSSMSAPENLLIHLLLSIKDFNDEVTAAESDVEVIRIEEYPELVDRVWPVIDGHVGNCSFIRNLKVVVRNLDQDLYDYLVSKSVRKCEKLPQVIISDLKSKHTWRMLKTDPQCFDYYWRIILKECVQKIHKICGKCKSCSETDPLARRFVRMSRWCQDLPINFVEQLLKNVKRHEKGRDLITLALLLEGPELERIITTSITAAIRRIPDGNYAQIGLELTCSVPRALSVANPPVSLDFMVNYCVGNCKHASIEYIVPVSRRTACSKVTSFAMDLLRSRPIAKPVSIRKLGIRLLCMVENAEHLHITLANLWTHETDQKIRKLLFRNVLKLFEAFPNDKNWELIKKCIDGLRPDDKYTFGSLMKFDYIPNEFIAEYVRKLFSLFRRLGDERNDSQRDVVWFYITKLLNIDKNILVLFSDELHNEIIDKYVLDLSLPKKVQSAGHSYLINYIVTARDKLEDRMNRFRNIFVKIVKGNLDVPHPTEPSFYPANYFVHELINNIIYYLPNNRLKRELANTATRAAVDSGLKTHQDPTFFLLYTFTSIVYKASPEELATAINGLLPKYAKAFGKNYIEIIANYLREFIDFCIGDRQYQTEVVDSLQDLGNDDARSLADRLMVVI